MRRRSANATKAQITPIPVDNREIGMSRHVVVKSPNSSLRCFLLITVSLSCNCVLRSFLTIFFQGFFVLFSLDDFGFECPERHLAHRPVCALRRAIPSAVVGPRFQVIFSL